MAVFVPYIESFWKRNGFYIIFLHKFGEIWFYIWLFALKFLLYNDLDFVVLLNMLNDSAGCDILYHWVSNSLFFLCIFLSVHFHHVNNMFVLRPFGFVSFSSFECQTVHWRQGHKLECRPRSITHQSDDVVGDLRKKVAEQDLSEIPAEESESEGTQWKNSNENPPISDTSASPKVIYGKNDDARVESLAEGIITDSNSELSSNSFSGFSASPSASESSDESSVCESVISNEHDRSEGHIFVDSTLDIPDSTSSDNSMGVAMSSSPKFASLVDSVDGFSTMRKLNQSRAGFSKESKLASNVTSGSSIWKGATIEPSRVDSGFWDKTLDSTGIKDDANDDPCPSHSNELTANKKSDSGSSFHFSFSTMPPLHVQDIEAKDSVSGDASPKSVGNNVPSPGTASSENDRMNSSKATNLSFMNSKDSNVTSYGTTPGSDSAQLDSKDSSRPPLSCFSPQSSSLSKDSGCADGLSIHNSQSAVSMASNHVVGNCGSTLKSSEIRCLTHELTDSNLASRTVGYSNSSTKCVNNGIQSAADTSSQGVSCSANPKSGLKTSVLKVVDQFRGSNLSKRFPLAIGSDTAGRYSDKVLLEQIFLRSFVP